MAIILPDDNTSPPLPDPTPTLEKAEGPKPFALPQSCITNHQYSPGWKIPSEFKLSLINGVFRPTLSILNASSPLIQPSSLANHVCGSATYQTSVQAILVAL
jgi:hypothetical protein